MARAMRLLLPLPLFALALAACALDTAGDTESSEADLVAASHFDHDGLSHHAQYVGLVHQNAPLRDVDGNPIGKTVSGSTIRMEGLEVVHSTAGDLYYTWGDGQPSGHIHVSDLAARPNIDTAERAGNGAACTLRTGLNGKPKSYFVRPQPIEGDLKYTGPSTKQHYSFKWYGTPGDPIDDYTYLSWSWVDRVGGGVARAVVRKDDVFYPCKVKSITTPSVEASGWVKAIYGMIQSNGHHYYGWIVHSHEYGQDPTVMHLAIRNP